MYDDYDPEDDLAGEGPSQADLDELGDDGPGETLPCPECGAEVYEQADRCPVCGNWVTLRHGGARNRPGWWFWVVAAAVAGLVAAIWLW